MELKSVIFIRRDNIGDLVCTTPAISALRKKYPEIKIGVLVNSYNAEALRNNPDINEIFIYEKEKHSAEGKIKVLLSNISLIKKVRGGKFDASIGCSYGYSERLARYTYLTGGKMRIGFVPKDRPIRKLFYNTQVIEPEEPIHEVEAMMKLIEPLDVNGAPPPLLVMPEKEELKRSLQYLKRIGLREDDRLVTFMISSRKPQNRWPKERFKELGDKLQDAGFRILLLWSPGKMDNPLHPGDDEKAEWLLTSMKKRPLAYRTETLSELIAVMSLGEVAVCSDGGAMHIAAALGKPVLTVWGSTERKRWAPWGVPHIILQKDTKLAQSVTTEEAFLAFNELYMGTKQKVQR